MLVCAVVCIARIVRGIVHSGASSRRSRRGACSGGSSSDHRTIQAATDYDEGADQRDARRTTVPEDGRGSRDDGRWRRTGGTGRHRVRGSGGSRTSCAPRSRGGGRGARRREAGLAAAGSRPEGGCRDGTAARTPFRTPSATALSGLSESVGGLLAPPSVVPSSCHIPILQLPRRADRPLFLCVASPRLR